jgi:hypothetical protein
MEMQEMSATQLPTFEQIMATLDRVGKRLEEVADAQKEDAAARAAAREESERERKERDKKWEEKREELDRKIGQLGNRIGDLVESMIASGVLRLFQEQGYEFDQCSQDVVMYDEHRRVIGEIDLFLENGDVACLVEVKTKLTENDVVEHIAVLELFRKKADAKGDKRQFISAVGGGIVRENVRKFAQKQGMFVIQQSGENVEIIPPDGEPKVW